MLRREIMIAVAVCLLLCSVECWSSDSPSDGQNSSLVGLLCSLDYSFYSGDTCTIGLLGRFETDNDSCKPGLAKQWAVDTKDLTKVADRIVLVRVTQLEDDAKPADSPKRVRASVIETLKGKGDVDELTICTTRDMETGDAHIYAKGHTYLVFLNDKGDCYWATFGRSGLFEKKNDKIEGWPKPGEPTIPKPDTLVPSMHR